MVVLSACVHIVVVESLGNPWDAVRPTAAENFVYCRTWALGGGGVAF